MTPEVLTPRLALRRFDPAVAHDLDFIRRLLNQPSFIRGIADRGVRTRDDARRYLEEGPCASFARHGFGLMAVERHEDGVAVGMCGLLQRDYLPHPDIGYALVDAWAGRGYAREAAAATLDWGWRVHRMTRILATTATDNEASKALLRRLGFREEGRVQLPAHAGESCYFVVDAPAAG